MFTFSQIDDYFSDKESSTIAQASNNLLANENAGQKLSEDVNLFAQLLSSAQTSLSENFASSGSELTTDSAIGAFQSKLLSGLGLEGLDKETLVSNESLNALQSSLLVSLQTSLFKNANLNDGPQQLTDTATASASKTKEVSIFSGMLDSINSHTFGDDGLGITDGFDAINILNHVPIVSDIYKDVTATDVSAASRLTGGYLYGGVAGIAYGVLNLSVERITGESIQSNLWELGKGLFSFTDEHTDIPQETIGLGKDIYEFARKEVAR